MDGAQTIIIGMLGSAVAAEFGFIVWLFKSTLARADSRIAALELREDHTLTTLAESIRPIPELIKTLIEGMREFRLQVTYPRGPSDRG